LYNCEVKSKNKKIIKVKGEDLESLMYNFLEEFLFLLDSEEFLATKIEKLKIDAKKFSLSCVVYGDNTQNYPEVTHIKAITYNEMFIKKNKSGNWKAQVVLDV
jgi:SHS2 domain-containing protein